MKWVKRILITLAVLFGVLLLAVVGILWYLQIPTTGSAMAAKALCSASFVAGRSGDADTLMEQDVVPASPLLFGLVSAELNEEEHYATGTFLGMFKRQASLVTDRGCVLGAPADPSAVPYTPAPADPAPWPAGDAPQPPAGFDDTELTKVVDEAFADSGDPQGANARGVAVVQNGKLLLVRDGKDIEKNVALHGWSMTKTVAAMLAYKKFEEVGLDIETPVIDAFPEGKAPEWVAQWAQDERAEITVADLMYMRAGLKINEGYEPGSDVLDMLYNQPNMADWAADHPSEFPPGTSWEYLSAVSNILAQIVEAQFGSQQEYWDYSKTALFDPIGVKTATLETDESGTWVGSSYLWASVTDWARLGEVMLKDGQWQGQQVLPADWWETAGTSSLPEGEGAGYGAQTWIPANPVGGECKGTPGIPEDALYMGGHWGQTVAMVPSRDAVIVRMGWTFNGEEVFDRCQFLSDVLETLPE
ncbi:MAG: beta-lactamase family protein [Candidatus Nanopelagicales bacterium]|nr:beta-lactamase family protein [Candidatus Nanopelagicales bacterium]MCU0295588.1 beta-lactamase family protein [Candidatus Nanopelagicales bacterium]